MLCNRLRMSLSDAVCSRFRRVLVAFAAGCLLVLAGCGGDEGGERPDGVVEHPIIDSILHADRNHISIDRTRMIDEMEEVPEAVIALADYLEDPEGAAAQKLDVLVHGSWGFFVASLGEDRLVLVDAREPRILEYDLAADEATVLAEQGQGPGDVNAPQDMAREGASVYVAMADRRIEQYDCAAAPCTPGERIRLDFMPLSMAPAGDTTMAVLGQIPPRDDPDPEADARPVRLVGASGHVLGAFGAAYRTPHFSVRGAFLREGKVRHSEELGLYVVAQRRLPYVYVYDEHGELHHTYEVEGFVRNVVLYGNLGPGGRPAVTFDSDRDASNVYDVKRVDGGIVLIRTGLLRYTDEGRVLREDYHVLDLSEERSYYVGGEAFTVPNTRAVFITDAGLVLNESGTLSFVAY